MKQKRRGLSGAQKEAVSGYLFLTPFILGFALFILLPMGMTLFMSFTDWNVLSTPQMCGISNYRQLFEEDPYFWKSLGSTLLYATGGTVLPITAALFLAVLLNQKIRLRALFRTAFYVPCVLPAVSTAILWSWIYNPDFGLLNAALDLVGLPGSRWIYGESSVIPSLWLMSIWGCGSTMIIFLAALQDIPQQLLEAAEIDGAGAVTKFRKVTLPFLSPVLFFNLLMGIIGTLQVFVPAQIMTGGGPNNKTLFLTFYIYRLAFSENKMGYASALAFVVFLLVMAISVVIFRTSNRWVFYNEEKN